MKRALELSLGPLLLAFAAVSLGSSAVLAIAIGLALVYAGANHVVAAGQRRVRVTRSLITPEVIEGHPVRVQVEVVGLGRLPVGVERHCVCGKWHRLQPGGAVFSCPIGRPGRHAFDSTGFRIRDDLGLLSRPIELLDPIEVMVLPAPLAAVLPEHSHHRAPAGDPEPDGLREYVPGSPVSRIHWASLATGGPLQERSFVYEAEDLPLVIVDLAGEPTPEQLAWAARHTAGVLLGFARTGGCRVLLPGDRAPAMLMDGAAGWPPIHRRLAELAGGAVSAGAGGYGSAPGHGSDGAVVIVAASAGPEQATALPPLPPGVIDAAEGAAVRATMPRSVHTVAPAIPQGGAA